LQELHPADSIRNVQRLASSRTGPSPKLSPDNVAAAVAAYSVVMALTNDARCYEFALTALLLLLAI
jgi:hypothetical protein